MNTLNLIIGFIALATFGYILLKEGLHKEKMQEKMLKLKQPPQIKRFPKWYVVVLGIVSWGTALYFAIKFFLFLVV